MRAVTLTVNLVCVALPCDDILRAVFIGHNVQRDFEGGDNLRIAKIRGAVRFPGNTVLYNVSLF